MTTTDQHLSAATARLEGRDRSGFPIRDEYRLIKAMPHIVAALVGEQQTTNAHLASLADSLARIATALERQATQTPAEPAPPRRLWLPRNRKHS
ncbi:hypothetical protein GCM10010406_21320 [Streptomyces thermolineatus]|uniref:Uncharacterized protein n=1 Tax=Streptomyces thermolineatus TaxID=44033 RepID=A0ABP5YPV1_9ACTN